MDMLANSTSSFSGFKFDNSYIKLPSILYQKRMPESVKHPTTLLFNAELATELGLDAKVLEKESAQFLSGNAIYPSSTPIAQAYAGHQFGGFNILGDGRAILLGEHLTPYQQRVDIQLKGAGKTAYSRSGDGRAALGPMLREYIISEAMHALGIPTTRSLAVVETGETVYRDDAYPGAVLTRVASSHIRVGTFQFAAALDQPDVLSALADYTIDRHFPDLSGTQDKYTQLLASVIALQAQLIAKWMLVGFIHGVMNTDNMSISGETIDYGPCAFMNHYDPSTVFSSIDTRGRYAFANQAPIAHWNLYRFAESLLPLLHEDQNQAIAIAEEMLISFPTMFLEYWLAGIRKKLGLFSEEQEDTKLAEDLLMLMHKNKADFTNTFRALGKASIEEMQIYQDGGFKHWLEQWRDRLSRQPETIEQSLHLMDENNPAIIPRNHLVENALNAAVDEHNFAPFHQLLAAVSNPYTPQEDIAEFTKAPLPQTEIGYKTFCGT